MAAPWAACRWWALLALPLPAVGASSAPLGWHGVGKSAHIGNMAAARASELFPSAAKAEPYALTLATLWRRGALVDHPVSRRCGFSGRFRGGHSAWCPLVGGPAENLRCLYPEGAAVCAAWPAVAASAAA